MVAIVVNKFRSFCVEKYAVVSYFILREIFDRLQEMLNQFYLVNRNCLAESNSLYKNDFHLYYGGDN